MKKIKLFTLLMLLSASVMSQTTLTLGRMDTLCSTGQMPNATNMNNILYTLYNRPGSGNNNAPLFFVTAATTTSLAANTYSSGTITAVSNGRLANVDGVKLMLGDSVLLKNESSQLKNGIYIISDTGTTVTKAKMYRNPRYNTTGEIYPSQVNVLSGTVNVGLYFLETTINPVVGTSPIVYTSIPAPTSWLLTGNSGTTAGANYIGTNDAQPFAIKTNASEKARFLTNGNLGLGTTTPTFDLSFGNASNRKMWIENTDSVTAGKSFTIQAGSTIAGGSAGGFLSLSQTSRNYHGMCAAPNGDVYVCVYTGDIYKQTGGVGNFIALGQTSRQWYGMAAAPNGDVYACTLSGDIYKQTGGIGNFIALGQVSRSWISMCAAPNGDLYACVNGGDIYKQTGGVGNFIALGGTVRGWFGMTASPNGDIYASVSVSGDIYKQTGGIGSFVALSQTLRNYQGMAAASNGDIYVCVNGGDIYKQSLGIGNFNALGQASRSWFGMAGAPNGDVYANTTSAAQIYKQANGGNVPGGNLVLSSGQSKGTSPSDIIFTTPITNTVSSSLLNPFSTKIIIRGNSVSTTVDSIFFSKLGGKSNDVITSISNNINFYNDSSIFGSLTGYSPTAFIRAMRFNSIKWDARQVLLKSSAVGGLIKLQADSGAVGIVSHDNVTISSDTGKVQINSPLQYNVGSPGSGQVMTSTDAIGDAIWSSSSSLGVVAPTPNTLSLRDASANLFANNFNANQTLVTSAGTTTTLTVGSARIQQLIGSLAQTFKLPDATTLTSGFTFEFNNNSSGNLTVVTSSGASTISIIPQGGYARIRASTISTTDGTWDTHYMIPANGSYGTSGMTITGSLNVTTSVSTSSVNISSAMASTFAGFDASKNLISGNITYVGAGTTTVTTTGTAPTQTVTINSADVDSDWSLTGNSGTTPGTNFIGTTDNRSLAFRTNNTERVRLDSLGNVGIGTSTPAATDALAIVGNNSTRKSITLQNTNSSGNASFYFQNDVGNFNSYGGLLHAGSSYGGNFFGVSAANKTVLISDGASSTGFMIGTIPAQPLIFGTTNLERMRILSGGNVGIGVTNPLAKLDISGNAYISSNVAIGTTSPDATDILAMVGSNTTRLSATIQNTNSSGNASFYFQNDRGSYNSYGGLLQGGSAFAGSFFGFSKADATFLIADGVNNLGLGIGTIPAQPLIFGTNNTERMRIGSNGVVTIATSSITINNVPYVFPSSQGAANTVIVNDGSGNLSWSSAYPTAWSSTNTITIGAQTTAPTKATTVQNDFVRYRTKEPAKGINTELIEVDYEYSATSNTGTAAGNGNYLFTLPNGYQFNSTEHPVYTGTNVLAGGSLSVYAIDRGKPQGMVFGDGFYDMVLIVPYSTTQFRIMPIGGNAPNAWVGSGWYPITQNTKVMSFKFQFYRQ